ncbi:MAG: GAF domain-containing sensor histidine kinase [Trueperaceae bacterium]|nr:GAF domain-containing sensor histidine kinase [Trueperaceae bacterium]
MTVEQKRLKELVTLNEIGNILNQSASFSEAIKPALNRLVSLAGLSTGWVFLSNVDAGDSHKGSFRLEAYTGLPPALEDHHCKALCQGSCECQGLLAKGKLDQGVNIVTCSRLSDTELDTWGLNVHASIPLLGRNGPEGILNLTAPGNSQFDQEVLSFFTAVGRQLGTAYDRSRLQEEQTREARYLAMLEERQRLVTAMHDSVSQLLFAADLSAQVAQTAQYNSQKEQALAQTASLIHEALDELRSLVEINRASELSGGIKLALKRLVKRASPNVNIHLEADDLELEPDLADIIYKVSQEALQNALRHANAEHIWLKLKSTDNKLILSIRDDGTGFDLEQTPFGLGLGSMRRRVESCSGVFKLATQIGTGTHIEVRL